MCVRLAVAIVTTNITDVTHYISIVDTLAIQRRRMEGHKFCWVPNVFVAAYLSCSRLPRLSGCVVVVLSIGCNHLQS